MTKYHQRIRDHIQGDEQVTAKEIAYRIGSFWNNTQNPNYDYIYSSLQELVKWGELNKIRRKGRVVYTKDFSVKQPETYRLQRLCWEVWVRDKHDRVVAKFTEQDACKILIGSIKEI